MKLKLGTNDIFHCPEGSYRGILEYIGEPKTLTKLPCDLQVRARFRVKTSDGNQYLVARTFCADLSYGSDLYNFLASWTEGNFEPYLDENNDIHLNRFLFKEADLLVTVEKRATHKDPLVKISGIYPPGTLLPELKSAA